MALRAARPGGRSQEALCQPTSSYGQDRRVPSPGDTRDAPQPGPSGEWGSGTELDTNAEDQGTVGSGKEQIPRTESGRATALASAGRNRSWGLTRRGTWRFCQSCGRPVPPGLARVWKRGPVCRAMVGFGPTREHWGATAGF